MNNSKPWSILILSPALYIYVDQFNHSRYIFIEPGSWIKLLVGFFPHNKILALFCFIFLSKNSQDWILPCPFDGHNSLHSIQFSFKLSSGMWQFPDNSDILEFELYTLGHPLKLMHDSESSHQSLNLFWNWDFIMPNSIMILYVTSIPLSSAVGK